MLSGTLAEVLLNEIWSRIDKMGIVINTTPNTTLNSEAVVGSINHNSSEKAYYCDASGVFDCGNYTSYSIIKWVLYDENDNPLLWNTCSKSLADISQIEVRVTLKSKYYEY